MEDVEMQIYNEIQRQRDTMRDVEVKRNVERERKGRARTLFFTILKEIVLEQVLYSAKYDFNLSIYFLQ